MSFYYSSDTFSMIHVHNKFTIKKHCQDEKDMLEASYNGLETTYPIENNTANIIIIIIIITHNQLQKIIITTGVDFYFS